MDIKSLPKNTYTICIEDTALTLWDMQLIGERTRLSGLVLINCSLSDEHIRHLAGLERLVNLRSQGNPITDDALQYLSGMPKLRYLTMNDNPNLTGRGLKYLEHTMIDCIWMAGTAFDDEGLLIASRFKKLGTLGLNSTRITYDGLMAAAVNPRLKVIAKDLFTEEQMEAFEKEQRRLARKKNISLPEEEIRSAEERLTTFMKLIGDWNLYASSLPRDQTFSPETKQKCYEIYEEFCTEPRPRFGSPNTVSGQNPPEYSYFRIVDNEALSKNRIYLYCKDIRLNFDYRFLMKKIDDRWRVDSKQRMSGGWTRSYY